MSLNLGLESLSDLNVLDNSQSSEELLAEALYWQDEFHTAYEELSNYLVAVYNLDTIKSIVATEGYTPTLRKLVGDISLEAEDGKPGFWSKVKTYLKRIWDAFVGFIKSFFGMTDKRIKDLEDALNATRAATAVSITQMLENMVDDAASNKPANEKLDVPMNSPAAKSVADLIEKSFLASKTVKMFVNTDDLINQVEQQDKDNSISATSDSVFNVKANVDTGTLLITIGDKEIVVKYAEPFTENDLSRISLAKIARNNIDQLKIEKHRPNEIRKIMHFLERQLNANDTSDKMKKDVTQGIGRLKLIIRAQTIILNDINRSLSTVLMIIKRINRS